MKTRNIHPRKSLPLRLYCALGILILVSGCQSFQPFTEHSKAKFAAARTWANHGLECFQKGRIHQAKGLFSQATKVNPNDYQMRANLARTHLKSGELEQAINHMQQAVELSNNDPRLAVELGEMYLEAGRWLPAKRQAEIAIATDHQFSPAWVLNGKMSKAKGEYASALADFQRALNFSPDDTSIHMEIVETYRHLNQPLRALSTLENMLNKIPVDQQPEDAVIAKAEILSDMQQHAPAIATLKQAIENQQASTRLFLQLAETQMNSGNVSQARMTLVRGKQQHPREQVFDTLLANLPTSNSQVASSDFNFGP